MDGPPPQRWDRGKWITVFSSHSPTIREVTECLGLGLSPSASTTNRGIPKFDAAEFKKLSSEVTRLSKELPQDRDALLDFAADPNALEKELDDLMESLGPAIWGKDADRSRLVTPDASKKTYYKDLFYEDPEDRDILKIHLQRWIVIKACYYIRNRKLKKHSVGEEFETLADIEAGSPAAAQKPELVVKLPMPSPKLRDVLSPPQSPNATPNSGSPAAPRDSTPTEGPELLLNLRKRKSSAFASLSDGEDNSLAPRKRSYQSHTLPIQRKSPRKSIAAARLTSAENIPPVPSPTQLQSPVSTAATPDAGRPQLGPLSNNALNGAARPANPPSNTFAAVNSPSTTANASPSTFAAINAPKETASTPANAFSAVNAPKEPANASPSTFPAVNAPHAASNSPAPSNVATINASTTSAPADPNAFAAVNAPSGFTAVNAPGAGNVPIAPNPGNYSSPYSARPPAIAPNPQEMRHMSNGHVDIPPHHATPIQREHSPQKQHASYVGEAQIVPHPHHASHASITSNGSVPAQHYHSHSIPSGPSAGISNFQTRFQNHTPPNGVNLAPAPVLPSNAVPIRSNVNGHAHIEHRPASRAVSPTDTTLLQCELLGLLMRYFFPRDGQRLDEPMLLQNLEYIWSQNEGPFRRAMGLFYEPQQKILFAWMEERRKITQLQYSMEGQPGIRASEMVDRLLAMNDLRVMRLKWKALKTQDGGQALSPEDLLCKTFATMTKTEGTEHLFKDGLERLNESVFEFLRSEDMKISMGKR